MAFVIAFDKTKLWENRYPPKSAAAELSELASEASVFISQNRAQSLPHCDHAIIVTFSYFTQQGLLSANPRSMKALNGVRAV